jgi:flagellar M-ring protein FliF
MQIFKMLLGAVLQLGAKRIALLVVVAAVTVGLMSLSMAFLGKPVKETLYSGLDAEDVNLIGATLSEVGISYDVNVAGNAVLVEFDKTAQARMILAEKGLPKSDKSGYELFDQMGSLGLTSFMQQVTRVRALEGELVRTIQQLEGIKSARVHLAIKSERAFRGKDDQPSASVVIRTQGQPRESAANSIRQVVAAAIPGLRPEHVTVMTTDGSVLSTAGYGENAEPDQLLGLETKIAAETQARLEHTLAPFVGLNNLRVSVAARLNTDRRQVTETNYDPESKVERSSKTTKASDSTNNTANAQSVSAEQNIPQEVKGPDVGDSNSAKKESKEETVNYEVNSKQIATVSNGYSVQKLSLAIVLNKLALLKAQGESPDDTKIAQQLTDIESIAKSAAGFDDKRGDVISVTAVEFIAEDASLEPLAGPGFAEILMGNFGTLVNAASLLLALLLVILVGLRPALRLILDTSNTTAHLAPASAGALAPPLDSSQASGQAPPKLVTRDLGGPRDKLNKVVEIDVDRAAQVLKQWLDRPAQDAA